MRRMRKERLPMADKPEWISPSCLQCKYFEVDAEESEPFWTWGNCTYGIRCWCRSACALTCKHWEPEPKTCKTCRYFSKSGKLGAAYGYCLQHPTFRELVRVDGICEKWVSKNQETETTEKENVMKEPALYSVEDDVLVLHAPRLVVVQRQEVEKHGIEKCLAAANAVAANIFPSRDLPSPYSDKWVCPMCKTAIDRDDHNDARIRYVEATPPAALVPLGDIRDETIPVWVSKDDYILTRTPNNPPRPECLALTCCACGYKWDMACAPEGK